jgi:cytidylate kinase
MTSMDEMYESSGTAQMVEQQWKKWLLLTQQKAGKEDMGPLPTVTISRERGSGGGLIAKEAADRLGFIVFDSEIVDQVARSASVDRIVVMHMDERSRHSIKEWTDRVIHRRAFSGQTYMVHLAKTILALGEHGRAVIVGRGAHLLLPVERCFRVRVVAPLEIRIERLAASTGMGSVEAETVIAETDQQRSQFIHENFQQSDANPLLYDLVINTGEIALDTAANLVAHAVEAKFPQVLHARASLSPETLRPASAQP